MKASSNRIRKKIFAVMLTHDGNVDAIEADSIAKTWAKIKKQAIRKSRNGDKTAPKNSKQFAVINSEKAICVEWLSISVSETKEQALIAALKFIKKGNHHV